MSDFPHVSKMAILKYLEQNHGHYPPSHKSLAADLSSGLVGGVLKQKRSASQFPPVRQPSGNVEFDEDRSAIQQDAVQAQLEKDSRLAMELNEEQYAETGQLLSCGCCCGEVAFDSMTQCTEGHLFCKECLIHYVQTVVFGGAKAKIACMDTGGCTGEFRVGELERALPPDLHDKLCRRVQGAEIAAAHIEGVEQCPFCDFACVIEASTDEVRIFRCANPCCGKESCRLCRKKEHVPLRCDEVETDGVASLRTAIEEAKSKALVRECPQCRAEFLKSDGCNKMTCHKCGSLSCYVCRVAISAKVGYAHFCQHPRDPNKPCRQCTKCNLWDPAGPSSSEEALLSEAAERAKRDYLLKHPDKAPAEIAEYERLSKRPRQH
mmetsp:Transcript_29723/g.69867  ORF Transcript_29723/g.69867 Transcript_29723/m.69867 type:complete len:378 (+) Transcript_29723:535-1668(+)